MARSSIGHVFISYSRRDDEVTQRIVAFLRSQDIKVWLDNEKLIPGTPIWEEEIEKAIDNAFAVVAVLSPDSKNSEWVRREITLTEQYKKRIFPVLVRGDENSSISLRLITRQFVDLRQDEEIGLRALKAALFYHLEEIAAQEFRNRDESLLRNTEQSTLIDSSESASKTKKNSTSLTTKEFEREEFRKETAKRTKPAKSSFLPVGIAGIVILAICVCGYAAIRFFPSMVRSLATTERPATELPATEPLATEPSVTEWTATEQPISITPSQTETNDSSPFVISIQDQVAVFDGPSYNQKIIGQLHQNDTVIAVMCSDANCNWFEVALPTGGTGWIINDHQISYSFAADKLGWWVIDATATVSPPQMISPTKIREINIVLDGGLMDATWDGNRFWIINRISDAPGKVMEIDEAGNFLRQWPLAGAYLFGSTFDGSNFWYVETNIGWIFSIQLQTGQIVKQISTPGWGNIHDLAWDGKYIWASSSQPHRIYKVDPASGTEIESFPGPIPPSYNGPLPDFEGENNTDLRLNGLAWDGKYLWVCEETTKTIMAVNPYTGDVVDYFVSEDATYPEGLEWDGKYLWVSDWVGKIIGYEP